MLEYKQLDRIMTVLEYVIDGAYINDDECNVLRSLLDILPALDEAATAAVDIIHPASNDAGEVIIDDADFSAFVETIDACQEEVTFAARK